MNNSQLIPSGYKQTEVGIIPEDWEVRELTDLLDQSRSIRYGIVQPGEFEPRGCLMLRSQDYSKGWVSPDEMHKVNSRLENQYRNARIRSADLILTIVGAGIGQVEVAPPWLDGAILSRSTARIAVDEAKAARRFVAACLESPVGKRQILNCQKEGAQPVVSCRDLTQFLIPTPPLSQQEAIAEALSDADALIESLEQLLVKKRLLKQGAMQELLTGKKRLPGFEIKPGYKQTEVGVVPEDWEVASVGQHLLRTPSYGINAPAISFDSRFPRYLRITDITEDSRFSEATKASVEHHAAGSYLLETGDIVFARTGASVGKSYLYNPRDGRLVFAGFLIRLSPDPERLVPAFLSFYAQSRPYWNWVKVNSMRSGQPGINGREYASLPIPLPPTKAEQAAIAAILSDMDAEIAALETKLIKARQIKQGMMQELLTGRILLV